MISCLNYCVLQKYFLINLTQRWLSLNWQNCAQFISLVGGGGGDAYGLRFGTWILWYEAN